jgi:hypothetical protein
MQFCQTIDQRATIANNHPRSALLHRVALLSRLVTITIIQSRNFGAAWVCVNPQADDPYPGNGAMNSFNFSLTLCESVFSVLALAALVIHYRYD